MAFNVQTEAPPLAEDASGALRVGSSRVLMELVVRAFQDGATPETIGQRYSTLEIPMFTQSSPTICAIRMRSRSTWLNASKRQSKFGNELRVSRAT
jgi:hypothetical protein